MPSRNVQALLDKGYEAGFVTAVESDSLPPGLDEHTVRAISERKGEPDFMRE
jgi:Fe-S cluster assembly protein SufB